MKPQADATVLIGSSALVSWSATQLRRQRSANFGKLRPITSPKRRLKWFRLMAQGWAASCTERKRRRANTRSRAHLEAIGIWP